MTINLISPLPLRECVRRLRAATDGGWAVAGAKPVLGFVGDTSIRLRKRSFYRQSAQCWLSGKFVEENGQTRLTCTLGLHPFARVFLEFWIGGVLIGGGFVLVRTLRVFLAGPPPLPPYLWLGVAIPLVMLVFGVILLLFGDHLISDDPRYLVEFVERTINAREDGDDEVEGVK